jgi:hypothetical protein
MQARLSRSVIGSALIAPFFGRRIPDSAALGSTCARALTLNREHRLAAGDRGYPLVLARMRVTTGR